MFDSNLKPDTDGIMWRVSMKDPTKIGGPLYCGLGRVRNLQIARTLRIIKKGDGCPTVSTRTVSLGDRDVHQLLQTLIVST